MGCDTVDFFGVVLLGTPAQPETGVLSCHTRVYDFGLTGSSPYIFHVGNDLTWQRILMTHVSEHFFPDFFFLLKRDMFLTQQTRKDNFGLSF